MLAYEVAVAAQLVNEYRAEDSPVVMPARGEADKLTVRVQNRCALIPEEALETFFTR